MVYLLHKNQKLALKYFSDSSQYFILSTGSLSYCQYCVIIPSLFGFSAVFLQYSFKSLALISASGLKSTDFSLKQVGDNIIINTTGYGHGVGMSQVGANYYAKQGYTFDKIITHYYTGVDVTYINREDKTNEIK